MPLFEHYTPETIKASILERIGTELQTREGSYTNDLLSPVSFELWRWCMTLEELVHAFYVDGNSGSYLDKHAALLGLVRKLGTKARAVIRFTGRDGVTVPAGTAFFDVEGLEYDLLYDAVIRDGEAEGYLQAAETGERYNAGAGEITRILRNIPGLESWTNEAAQGGTDPESDGTLFERIDYRRKNPSTSGNEHHYVEWALACDGVGAAKVTGLWAGPGTVRVLLVGYDRQPVDQAVVDAAAAYIQTQRPVGADVTVMSAASTPISVSAAVTLAPGADLEVVRGDFVSKLDTYLKELSFESYVVYVSRIASLLMDVEGVLDYTELTINGGAANVAIAETAVPVIGEVALT